MQRVSTIAIDGQVASGKTAVGRLLAQRLGFQFLDTGLMYRAVTVIAINAKASLAYPESIVALARGTNIKFPDLRVDQRVVIDGWDATDSLRSSKVELLVSHVAQIPGVRDVLVAEQRKLAATGCMVMAGRDIGTVVLPGADLKLFLCASLEERTKRRWEQYIQEGRTSAFSEIGNELEQRDRLDTERYLSPLRQAEEAIVLDTDDAGVDELVTKILQLVADGECNG